MKAYSVDLRQRVADAVLQARLPWAQVARLVRLSIASMGRFVLARRRGQRLTPRHSSDWPPTHQGPRRARLVQPLRLRGWFSMIMHRGGSCGYELPPSARSGSANAKTAPRGMLALAQSRPPCASMIDRLMASPMPKPCGLVV
jgi:hypothetical protein